MQIVFLILYLFMIVTANGQELSSLEEAKQIAQQALDHISSNVTLSQQQISLLTKQVENIKNDKIRFKDAIANLQKQQQQAKEQLEKDSNLFKKYRTEQAIAQKKYDKVKVEFIHISGALAYMQLKPPPILVVQPQTIRQTIRGADLLQIIVPKIKDQVKNYNKLLIELNNSIENSERQKQNFINTINNYKINTEKLNLLLKKAQENEKNSKQQIIIKQQNVTNLYDKTENLQKFLEIVKKQQNAQQLLSKKEELKNKLSKLPKFITLKGKLALPVKGKVIKNYYIDKNSNKHGELLLAINDEKVTIPHAAIVEYAGKFRSYGNIVILNMGSNYYMILCGFKKLFVENNSFINKNTVLGLVDRNKTIYAELKHATESLNLQLWWLGL